MDMGTICVTCGNDNPGDAPACLRCGTPVRDQSAATAPVMPADRSGSEPVESPYPLRALANALTVLLGVDVVLFLMSELRFLIVPSGSLTGITVRGASGVTAAVPVLLLALTAVLFLVWFFRARHNAAMSSQRQRYHQGWAFWAWFLPPVLLWFPYQIMSDIWRAGQLRERRGRLGSLGVVVLWWMFWLLAWITSYEQISSRSVHGITVSLFTSDFGGTHLSAAFAVAAAIMLTLVVRTVTYGPVGGSPQLDEPPADPQPAG